MALTEYQRTLCQLIAENRRASGESYVAGGAALNAVAGECRLSRDIDLFHDTAEALAATWPADRALLEANGYSVQVLHERRAYVEALARKNGETVLLQWTCDSAYRFFPLVEHADFGLTLHPVDLATNKVLAAVGRLEVRDWVDLISCHNRIQPLGYLVWAACGKDPAFGPLNLVEQMGRACRYSAEELAELSFEGEPPAFAEISRHWHAMLDEARGIVSLLPNEHAGKCVLDTDGSLYRNAPEGLAEAFREKRVCFHSGKIRGAYPRIVGEDAASNNERATGF